MFITHLELKNFRNYQTLDVRFDDGINFIEGNNGSGKTNIVEAIHFLSLAKSWRTNDSSALIRNGEKATLIRAEIKESELHRVIEILITAKGKKITINGKPAKRLSELSKMVNVILFAPEDIDIFKGSPSNRRNFLDVALSKQSLDYFSLIGKYARLLQERNAVLKSPKPDSIHIDVLTKQMIEVSEPIARYRRVYVEELNKTLSKIGSELYGQNREMTIVYKPFIKAADYKEVATKAYAKSLENDLFHKSTSVGIHREDFSLLLDGHDISLYGSQGENRLAAIALKLTPFFLIEDEDKKPITVLDDVYSELDVIHSERLANLIRNLGQVFVTGTRTKIKEATTIAVFNNNATRRK